MKMSRMVMISVCSGMMLVLTSGCATAPAKGPAGESLVVATVNGRAITLERLNARLSSIPQGGRIDPGTSLGKRAVLDIMINQELLLQEAEKAGIPKRKEIQALIKSQTEQIILNQLISEKLGTRLDVTDDEVALYYEKSKDSLIVPEKRRVRHILVEKEEDAFAAKKELDEGADFASLVEKYAIESGKGIGGDLGFIEKSNTIPEFADATFALNAGEASEPVKTHLGYHIIQLLEIKKPEQLFLEDSKDAIKRFLMTQKQELLLRNWVNELKAQSDISIKGSELAKSANYKLETLKMLPGSENK